MAQPFFPPFNVSTVDQDLSRSADPHFDELSVGDRSDTDPGQRKVSWIAYNGATEYSSVFEFDSTGKLSLWANVPGSTLLSDFSVAQCNYYRPSTFASPVTITDATSAALNLPNGGASIYSGVLADYQGSSYRFQVGSSDAFSRRLLWYGASNDADPDDSGGGYAGDGPIFVLGASAADGWPINIISEGIVAWGQDSAGNPLSNLNYAYARIKPSRFQLRHFTNGGAPAQDVFRADNNGIKWRPPDTSSDIFDLSSAGVSLDGGMIATGDVTSATKIACSTGIFDGKIISGGEWWYIYQIATETNDMLAMEVTTKDIDTKDGCLKKFYVGSRPSETAVTWKHNIETGSDTNQPRIIAFNAGYRTATTEIIVQYEYPAAIYPVAPPGSFWQSFTAVTGKEITEYAIWCTRNSATNPYFLTFYLYDGVGTGGTLLDQQPIRQVASGAYHWEVATPSTAISVVAGNQYTIAVTTILVQLHIYEALANPYSGGQFSAKPGSDIWFYVKTAAVSPPSAFDVFIQAQPETVSRSDVKITGALTAPIWTSSGTGTWPTEYPLGAGIVFDSADTGTYPPNTNLEIGRFKSWDTTDCTSPDTGAMRVAGGIYAAKTIWTDTALRAQSLRLEATGVKEHTVVGAVQTLDATPAALISFVTTTDRAYTFSVAVSFGSVANGTGSATFMFKSKNIGGTVTNDAKLLYTTSIDPALVGSSVGTGITGTTVEIVVTGLAATTIDWGGSARIIETTVV